MKIHRSLALTAGLAVLAPLALPAAGGAEVAHRPTVTDAEAWLWSQQQADGSFELAGFPGFETPDAISAIAAAANVGKPGWDAGAALAAVRRPGTDGADPLDVIDDLIDGEADPASDAAGARAAKVAALVAEPLGLDVHDFDPSDDTAGAVDLIARADQHRQDDGSYDFGAQFNGVLFTAIARHGAGLDVPAGLVAQIRAAQRADGSWDYTGTPDGDGEDIDTTAVALLALRSAGLTTADADVAAGVAFLASRQQATGAWQAYSADDPNSTATAAVALSALHVDLSGPAWRAAAGSPATGGYGSPLAWLASQQATDGHIASPNDQWGVTTFATSQAIEALGQQWYLTADRAALVDAWSRSLASPAAAPASGAADSAGTLIGTNPSLRPGRQAGALEAVTGLTGREAAMEDLYQAAFGRSLDPSGQAYWSAKLVTLSRPEILARLTGSGEYYRRAGGTIPSFVDAVYGSVLGRTPDPSGRAYWVGRLEAGTSVRAVARSLTASHEYRRKQVEAAYERVLDRDPTAGESAYWSDKILRTRVEVLLTTLGSSPELWDAVGS